MKKHLLGAAAVLFAASAAGAGLLGTAGMASAAPKTTYTVINGVTLANMWMHCNAYGGYYEEGSGSATCILPNGQTIVCTSAQCVISNVSQVTNTNGIVVSRSNIVGMLAN